MYTVLMIFQFYIWIYW